MRIIFSPTKTMQQPPDAEKPKGLPVYLQESQRLLERLSELKAEELKKLWGCSNEIVEENLERIRNMDLKSGLTAAIYAFEGIAFKYLDSEKLGSEEIEYLQDKLRILSGFYGVLKPLDGVRPYRLDMEHRLSGPGFKNLYDFWGDKIYEEVRSEDGIIINLASKEYTKCVEKYLRPGDRLISCSFVENVKGQLKQKATFSKMARGAMLRFMAENKAADPDELKSFSSLGFVFREELSSDRELTFEKL